MLVVTDDLQVQNTRWFIRQLLTSWKRFIHSEAMSIGFDTGSMTACAASANPEVCRSALWFDCHASFTFHYLQKFV